MLRVAIGLLLDRVPAADSSTAQRWPRALLLVMVATTIGFGAFVAGLRAGHMYNTFPLMAGYWVPPGMAAMEPFWRNLFENPVSVQFIHRIIALSTLAVLGICTLLWVVPVWLGTLHQGGAVLLLSAVIVAGWCWRTRVHSPR